MVLLAAAVTTKTGKPLLSRQFVDISRVRIEGLIAAFSKLKGSDKQNTSIETENVRYLYQPLESLYMLVITSKQSNIMEDLDTLHLLAKLVPEYCHMLDESSVKTYAFELAFAFDEVVACGYKEKVNLQQVKTFTEMDSHEERIAEIVERNKQKEAKEEMKRRQKEIERERQTKMPGMGSGTSYVGMGSNTISSGGSDDTYVVKPTPAKQQPPPATVKKGMALGGGAGKGQDVLKALELAGELVEEKPVPGSSKAGAVAAAESSVKKEGVHLSVDEKISVTLDRDGGLKNMDVKGGIILHLADPNQGRIAIQINNQAGEGFQFRTHPNVNKAVFTKNNIIVLKDTSKSFPVQQPVDVVKWRLQSTDEGDIPFSVSCWPSSGSDALTVNMEYELVNENLTLSDVLIAVPIPGGRAPVVQNCDGSYTYNNKDQKLYWSIPLVDKNNTSGVMEFTIAQKDGSGLFPVVTTFHSKTPMSGIDIARVVQVDDKSPVSYSKDINFSTDVYELV